MKNTFPVRGQALFPRRLGQGDTIGVVSPSSPVTQDLIGQFDRGVDFLRGLGFQVKIGKHAFSNTLGYAAAPLEKAGDINQMFADDAVQAIICSQGGATANACLPYLDWEAIQRHPKIFLGISDITVLLNAMHHKTGLVTFHGNDLMWGFGRDPDVYDRQEFLERLVMGKIGEVHPRAERTTIRTGAAEGILLGGNLPCLCKLAGTPYFPDFTGAILFVEAIGIKPEICDHLFQQLKQMGVFDRLRGVIVGFIDGLQNSEHTNIQMEEVLLQVTAGYSFPILKVEDFGHNCPNTTLPVGCKVGLDAEARTFAILEPCVSE